MLSFRQVKNGSFLAPGLALIFDMDGVLVDSTAMTQAPGSLSGEVGSRKRV